MQSREGRFESLVILPQRWISNRLLTGVRLMTCHPSTGIQMDCAPPSLYNSVTPLFIVPSRCTRWTSSSHHKTAVLHTSRTEQYDRTFGSKVSRARNGQPGDVFVGPVSLNLLKSCVNKLPLT
nr:unnamed protein product [Callosobruchus chinensis]